MAVGQYLMYLRKSRRDLELEQQSGKADTLQRHRALLFSLAQERGYEIAAVFEEVVSGSTVAQRPEMKRLLQAVETGRYCGVLVMEISRLARGSTRDQGLVAETFACTGTAIITPEKIYDPASEADEEYFEFGLFLSRREYRAINRRLQLGRQISLREGKYIAGRAPYGYRRVKLQGQKGWTLEKKPPEAAIVTEIFRAFTGGESCRSLAKRLTGLGVAAPAGGSWSASAIRDVLKNPVYAGFLRWAYRPDRVKLVEGRQVLSRPVDHHAPLHRGLHPPLVEEAQWQLALQLLQARAQPPVAGGRQAANPLAGVVRCGLCGKAMVQLPPGKGRAAFLRCPTAGCPTMGSRREVVEQAMVQALEGWLSPWEIEAKPEEETRQALLQHRQALLRRKNRLCELLETEIYTPEEYRKRAAVLEKRLLETEAQLKAAPRPPQVWSIGTLYQALPAAAQNKLWKLALHHAVYRKSTGGRWGTSDLSLELFVRFAPPSQLPEDGLG